MNLRDGLTELTEHLDLHPDPDAAIASARRRRTRAAVGVPLAVAAVAVVTLPLLGPSGGEEASPPAQSSSSASYAPPSVEDILGLDYVQDGRIHTADGPSIPLPDLGDLGLEYFVDVPVGWIVGNRERAVLVTEDGDDVPLVDGLDGGGPNAPVVSADGGSLAWLSADGGELHAASITSSGLTGEVSTPVPEGVRLRDWAGGLVVLSSSAGQAGPGSWDVWDPSGGDFTAEGRPGHPYPTGSTPGETVLFYESGTGEDCWVQRDARSGAEVRRRCAEDLPEPVSRISPDGRYIIAGDDGETMLVDLTRFFDAPDFGFGPVCVSSDDDEGVRVLEFTLRGDGTYVVTILKTGSSTSTIKVCTAQQNEALMVYPYSPSRRFPVDYDNR